MLIPFEVQLLAGAWLFYLFDASLLLYGNELIFSVCRGRWAFANGSDVHILRKRPYLPNPLLPGMPIFRVCWGASLRGASGGPETLAAFLRALRPLQWLLALFFCILWGGLGWVALGHTAFLLPLILLVYGNALLLVVVLVCLRVRLGLDRKTVAKLAFDALACPPLALNLVRKISLARPLAGDPVDFARQALSPAAFAGLIETLCQRLDAKLLALPEEDARRAEIVAYRKKLKEQLP